MLQENPNNHLAYFRLFFIYREKKDYKTALTHILKVKEIDPTFKPIAVNYFIGEMY